MQDLPTVLSIIYFAAFAIYILFGFFALSLNHQSSTNRVFFILCLSLATWALGTSMTCSAPDATAAVFWHRVAALGCSILFALFLHFVLILTTRQKALNRIWLLLLLYAPSLLLAWIFALNGSMAVLQHDMHYSAFGWINSSALDAWDTAFNIYSAAYMIAGLALIWKWGKSAAEAGRDRKRQARILMASFAMAFVLGTATDVVLIAFIPGDLPEMGVVFSLIPVTAVASLIRRYGLLKHPHLSRITEEGKILSQANRVKIYTYIALAYFLGSFLNFVSSHFVYHAPVMPTLIFSAVLLFIGVCVYAVQRIGLSEERSDLISIALICLSIPLISLNFIEYASITVWAAPFIMVVMSIVFNRRRVIVLISVVIIGTQLLVWYLAPAATVQVEGSDHIARLGIFGIALWLAFFVNRIYINRLKENQAQIRFQQMITDISAGFVSISASNQDEKIAAMLKLSGEFFAADRCRIVQHAPEQDGVEYAYEWCREGVMAASGCPGPFDCEEGRWPLDRLMERSAVRIPNVDLLPETASREKALLLRQGVKSLIAVPISAEGCLLGGLVYETVGRTGNWQEDSPHLLRVLGNLLADALTRVAAEKEINYMAYHDPLTGLPNRILFNNRLETAISAAERTGRMVAVLLLDLDYFKAVNDTTGHEGGDELLRQVAGRLRAVMRQQDVVSRFGGDEFLLMLADIKNADDIEHITGTILSLFETPALIKGQEFYLTASVGIAIYPFDGLVPEVLVKNADLAMYSSKESGRNCYTMCSQIMKEDMARRIKLTNSLYRAIDRNELLLYYQPQVSVATGQIVGLEALLKWRHSELGIVSPDAFIPLAEQTGLINPIGQWVLTTACRQNRQWQESGLPGLRMAVNLSTEQFRNPRLVEDVKQALEESGLPARFLELEITESLAVRETGYAINVLSELKRLGVTIAIDDFGAEYSSLGRLKSLPVDRIKMDMQFIQGISDNEKDDAIARVIIQLARNLDLDIIAEGVETAGQLEFLASHGCDEVQGYYFYHPMPAEETEAILASRTGNGNIHPFIS